MSFLPADGIEELVQEVLVTLGFPGSFFAQFSSEIISRKQLSRFGESQFFTPNSGLFFIRRESCKYFYLQEIPDKYAECKIRGENQSKAAASLLWMELQRHLLGLKGILGIAVFCTNVMLFFSHFFYRMLVPGCLMRQ